MPPGTGGLEQVVTTEGWEVRSRRRSMATCQIVFLGVIEHI